MEAYFKNKNILVTGAGQGIGRGLALRLHGLGANVTAISRSPKHLVSLEEEAPGITTISLDLADWTATRKAVQGFGIVFDGLVNNAGVAPLAPFLEVTETDFDNCFDVNLKAMFNVSQIVTKEMVANGVKGSVVNVSSQASMAALQDHSVYCSSKAAVDGLTRNMALELGPHGIRVNSVNPTVILTPMGRHAWGDAAKAAPMLEKIPLGRFGEVHEVVDAILFLLSDMSSLMSGTCIPLDGGFLAC